MVPHYPRAEGRPIPSDRGVVRCGLDRSRLSPCSGRGHSRTSDLFPLSLPAVLAPPFSLEFDEPTRGPRSGTEVAFYQQYLALLRQRDERDIEAIQERLFAEYTTDPERIGILRASYDAPSPFCAEWLLAALEELPDESRPGLESVPSFCVRTLGEHLGDDPAVRETLEAALFHSTAPIAAGLRRRAASKLVANASADDLARYAVSFQAESDASLLAGVAASLVGHPHPAAAARLARALDLEIATTRDDFIEEEPEE